MKVTVCRCACFAMVAASSFATVAHAAPVIYRVDPTHTYPSFEADHMGISVWRGKMNKTEGELMLDKAAGNGWVDVKIDMGSMDFGQSTLNAWARGKNFFDIAASLHRAPGRAALVAKGADPWLLEPHAHDIPVQGAVGAALMKGPG